MILKHGGQCPAFLMRWFGGAMRQMVGGRRRHVSVSFVSAQHYSEPSLQQQHLFPKMLPLK